MRRVCVIAALVTAVLAPGALATAASDSPPRSHLDPIVCHRALDPAARYVSVTAVMRPLRDTSRMEVRFNLLERMRGASAFTAVTAPGLGDWISPRNPTLGQRAGDVWKVIKPVADLGAPAAYRFSVEFRWIGSGGRVVGTATRATHRCRQPELRPDLVVKAIGVTADPNHPRLDDYRVEIANPGATGAGPFTVAFADSTGVRDKVVDHLARHSERQLTFVGPVCDPAAPPSVTVDPQDQVDVSSRARATLVAACPAG